MLVYYWMRLFTKSCVCAFSSAVSWPVIATSPVVVILSPVVIGMALTVLPLIMFPVVVLIDCFVNRLWMTILGDEWFFAATISTKTKKSTISIISRKRTFLISIKHKLNITGDNTYLMWGCKIIEAQLLAWRALFLPFVVLIVWWVFFRPLYSAGDIWLTLREK